MLKTKMLWGAGTAAVLVLTGVPGFAQEQAAIEDQHGGVEEHLEEVVITGSRIKRADNAESAVPLQVFSNDDFTEAGTIDLAEALAEIPGVSEGLTARNSNTQIQNAGLSTISLRRLGDARTLVLLNGKRAVSNSGNNDRVSLSTIPSGLVERTEITTGGASAVYGSDAIAGVVNFLIEDDFEGFQIDTRYSTPEASGGEETRIDLKWGSEYADGRGYFMFAADYNDRKMIRADSSRPESIAAVEFDDPSSPNGGNSFANEINQPGCDPSNEDRHCILPSFSGSTPGGVFANSNAWYANGRWFNDKSLQPSDRTGSQDFYSDFDGYNVRPGRTLIGARELFNIGAYTEYEFNSGIKGSLLTLYNEVDTLTAGGFETLNDDDEFGLNNEFEVGRMSNSHPFIPPEVRESFPLGSRLLTFDRRLVELGEQQRINNRKTTRIMGDLTGELNDRFNWEVYATYGRFTQKNRTNNEYHLLRAQWALDIEDDGNGGFQCVNPDARAQGCVPLNIFGAGSISPEAADYIRYNGGFSQNRDQYTVGGFITGDLFTLMGREVKSAFGLEYRREAQETNGDPDGAVRLTSLFTVTDLKAYYEVYEAFSELDIPVTDTLSLQLAARIGDYTTVGAITSWNVGGVWRPSSQFGLRAQFSRAQRAPNLTEYFSPPRPDTDDLDDPCEDLARDGTGIDAPVGTGGENANLAVVAQNCLSEPGIQAFFNAPENAPNPNDPTDPGEPFDDETSSVRGPNSGNSDLEEETADTFTIGAIYQPDAIEGLTLIVDYYKIKISDAIDEVSTQDTVDLCYAATDFPNNKFCEVITRNSSNGSVSQVINFQENLNEETVEGIDASLEWNFNIPKIAGGWDLDLRYSHYLTDEVSFTGIGGVELVSTDLGEIDNADEEFRASLGYRYDGWRVRYTLSYEQGGVDDLLNHPSPSDNRYFTADSELFHRIYVAYNFGNDIRYRIYAGVDNITDNLGPVLPTGLNNGGSRNIISDLNDVDGRTFFLGVRLRM